MTDKPIIFSAPMVRALLDGRKTQTRRVLKPIEGLTIDTLAREGERDGNTIRCTRDQVQEPSYATGDRLYVREALIGARGYDGEPPSRWGNKPIWYCADGEPDRAKWWHLSDRKRSPIHMPRWASRLTLTVTDVRVQRLQEIKGRDIIAEGVRCEGCHDVGTGDYSACRDGGCWEVREVFHKLWNSLHGPDAWDANPWVCAISFDVHRGNIDRVQA